MKRPVLVALLAFACALAVWPLTSHKPGFPASLKSDEPAYYLAALSIAHDFDLRIDPVDLERGFAEYPYLAIQNLIVMSPDGWRTLFYGKPFIYPLAAAPFAGLFGANGLVFFNMLLLVAMLFMGFDYLRRFNPETTSALLSIGFFLVSTAPVYVFWLHPEIFNMFAGVACLYFGLVRANAADLPAPLEGEARRPSWWQRFDRAEVALAISATVLIAGAYNKPVQALLGLPVFVALALRKRWKELGVWLGAGAAAGLLLIGVSILWTGAYSSYLVHLRTGITVIDPNRQELEPLPETHEVAKNESAGWFWLFDQAPGVKSFELTEAASSFLVGRHTGLFIYQPFALLALGFFAFGGLRSARRWAVLVACAAIALFFLVWINFNWHGGGGFVGNRYFIMVYPALIFLVERVRPAWIVLPFYAFGGLFLGPTLFAPYSLIVPSPTLQAHVRSPIYNLLPLEHSLKEVPGYTGVLEGELYVRALGDQVRQMPDGFWIQPGRPVQIWIQSGVPLDHLEMSIDSPLEDNPARLAMGGREKKLLLGKTPQTVRFELEKPDLFRMARNPYYQVQLLPTYLYTLDVEIERGMRPEWRGLDFPFFYQGASLRFAQPTPAPAP